MTDLTKEIGSSVISTLGIAFGISDARFADLLKLAQSVVNFQVDDSLTEEQKAAEWNKYTATVTLGLSAHEAAFVGATIALYLHEGILMQSGAEDVPEVTAEGEAVWVPEGSEGWLVDSFRDVT